MFCPQESCSTRLSGLVSVSDGSSCRGIPWGLGAAGLVVWIVRFDGRPGNTAAKRFAKFQSNRTVLGAGLAASGA